MAEAYKCLQCGSLHGEPAPDESEHWYWKLRPNGRYGPFCSAEHAEAFSTYGGKPILSNHELDQLGWARYQIEQREPDNYTAFLIVDESSRVKRDKSDNPEYAKRDDSWTWDWLIGFREVQR